MIPYLDVTANIIQTGNAQFVHIDPILRLQVYCPSQNWRAEIDPS